MNIKTFSASTPKKVEKKIQKWLDKTGSIIITLHPSDAIGRSQYGATRRYTVLVTYKEAKRNADKEETKDSKKAAGDG